MPDFLSTWRNQLILAVLAIVLVLTPPVPVRWGDSMRFALPALGFGCAVVTGGGVDYTMRLALLNVGIFAPKFGLGDAPINIRPDGELRGFPSGHSAAAAFGASAIVHECAAKSPITRAAMVLAAGFTGASRVEADRHNVWQVLAGWVLGLVVERAFRRRTRAWFRRRRSDAA